LINAEYLNSFLDPRSRRRRRGRQQGKAMQLQTRKSRLMLPVLIAALSLSMFSMADDAKPAAPPAAAPPKLPAYFSGANPSDKPDDEKWPDPTGSNAGTWATPAGDGKGDIPTDLKGPDLYDRIAHNLFSINIVWAMVTGFLVMFMQAGFAMLEVGLCRPKNAANMAGMNLMIYPLGCLAFWVYGFAIGWGNWFNAPIGTAWYSALGPGTSVLNSGLGIGPHADGSGAFNYGLIGTKGFFLNGVEDVSVLTLFFFMMVFFDTTATIPTGAMAERWSWKSFCLYGLWVALPYCLFANWVWGGGFLAQAGINWGLGHGAVDFAGSGVVHAMGGVIGLAGAICLGPRIGRYINGKPQAMPGHHIPMVVFGTFILAFGWFGFNPGSTLAGTDLRLTSIVVNTMLASVTAGIAAMTFMMIRGMRPDPTMMCNGFLGGLVAITAPCAFVDSLGAAVIGAVAGVLVVLSVLFFDKVQVDDPIGALSVHGTNGIWGVISVGIFANGKYGAGWNGVERAAFKSLPGSGGIDGVRGILYGDASQLWAQLLDAGVLVVFGFVMAYVWFKASNFITPLRVSKDVELAGLDGPVMGVHAYPYFMSGGTGGEE
jgi:Amt family ammonium transporter